mgnify:CR=1 FL=1
MTDEGRWTSLCNKLRFRSANGFSSMLLGFIKLLIGKSDDFLCVGIRFRTEFCNSKRDFHKDGLSDSALKTVQASLIRLRKISWKFSSSQSKRIRNHHHDTCKCVLTAQTASEDSCNALQCKVAGRMSPRCH